jgi:hypothetical protein
LWPHLWGYVSGGGRGGGVTAARRGGGEDDGEHAVKIVDSAAL